MPGDCPSWLFEAEKDTDWYIESIDADIATFGDSAEDDVNWDGLFKERQRLHELERLFKDVQSVEQAITRRDRESLTTSLQQLVVRIRDLNGPQGEPIM